MQPSGSTTPSVRPEIEIDDATADDTGAVARALAAAFVDDPVWTAIGPRARAHRALANRPAFWGIVQGSRRGRARIRVARDAAGGPVRGATIAFADGGWPLPDSAFLWQVPWVFAAGPAPVSRGLRDDRAMRTEHIGHPHMYLWFVGVDPSAQGRGIGKALMADLHEWAEPSGLPVYLETGTRENAAFYASLGYAELGELLLPSGARLWRMERPGTDVALAG